MLTITQAKSMFEADGYAAPLAAIDADEAQYCVGRIENLERQLGCRISNQLRRKGHLLLTCLYDLVKRPAIVDAIEAVLGPDILCWGASLFIREPGSADHVPWHQDQATFGLSPPLGVSAWIALTDVSVANGAVHVVPGSHREAYEHQVTNGCDNSLLRRDEIVSETAFGDSAVPLELAPGTMALHDVRVVHGSPRNSTNQRRIGFAIRYISPYVKHRAGSCGNTGIPVRGRMPPGVFAEDPKPSADFDPATVAYCRRFVEIGQEPVAGRYR
jgi:ectoine hydroxylase-related dioxygenase (phytanoyl-CoA dioxygenase family)